MANLMNRPPSVSLGHHGKFHPGRIDSSARRAVSPLAADRFSRTARDRGRRMRPGQGAARLPEFVERSALEAPSGGRGAVGRSEDSSRTARRRPGGRATTGAARGREGRGGGGVVGRKFAAGPAPGRRGGGATGGPPGAPGPAAETGARRSPRRQQSAQ